MTPLALFLACTYPAPDCASGYTRDGAGSCTPGPVDTATADTGAATATTQTGDLTGPLEISVIADIGSKLKDACVGTVGLTLASADTGTTGDQPIDGTLSCAFEATIATVVGTDPFSGTITGSAGADGTAAGAFSMDLGDYGGLDADWSGTWDGATLSAAFQGETIFEVPTGTTTGAKPLQVPVTYSGTFEASP